MFERMGAPRECFSWPRCVSWRAWIRMKFYFREIFRPNAKIPIHSQKTRSVSVLRLRGIRGSGSGSECARLSLCGAGVHGVGIMSTLLERGTDRFCITSTGPVISQLLKSWPHFHQRATAPPPPAMQALPAIATSNTIIVFFCWKAHRKFCPSQITQP